MQIVRYLSVNEAQLAGCSRAFLDALEGEFQASLSYLRRLSGQRKGSAFGFEMQLDRHRYGAIIVLDRWAAFAQAFVASIEAGPLRALLEQAPERTRVAAELLDRANRLLDAADTYEDALIDACQMAFQTVERTFAEERAAAEVPGLAGSGAFEEYRRVFGQDLSVR